MRADVQDPHNLLHGPPAVWQPQNARPDWQQYAQHCPTRLAAIRAALSGDAPHL